MNQTRSSITYYVVCRQERKMCYLVKYIMIECEYKTIYYRTVQYCSYNTVTILQNSLQQCTIHCNYSTMYSIYYNCIKYSIVQCTIHYSSVQQTTIYSVQCTVYNIPCTMYSVPCTVYNVVYNVVFNVQCSVKCTAQCTMYSRQCTVYNVQYTMYSIQCTDSISSITYNDVGQWAHWVCAKLDNFLHEVQLH